MKLQLTFNKLFAGFLVAFAFAIFTPVFNANAYTIDMPLDNPDNTITYDNHLQLNINGILPQYSSSEGAEIVSTLSASYIVCTNVNVMISGRATITGNNYTDGPIEVFDISRVVSGGENIYDIASFPVPSTPGQYNFTLITDIYYPAYEVVAKSKMELPNHSFERVLGTFDSEIDAQYFIDRAIQNDGYSSSNLRIRPGKRFVDSAEYNKEFTVVAPEVTKLVPTVKVWSDAPNNTIQSGGSTMIHWESDNATQGCNSPQLGNGLEEYGDKPTGPLYQTTTFNVTCSGE